MERGLDRIDMDLNGKLLVAMPGMADLRFDHSVILICAHSADGAMGLIVNKPVPDISFNTLLEQLNMFHDAQAHAIRVHFGGPVDRGRGFVLHSTDYGGGAATIKVGADFGMTATLDVLEAIAAGKGPDRALLALGYAGWGPGQLESEIARNDWLTADASAAVIFSENDGSKWAVVLREMGIDPLSLSAISGRA
jgi:putative transcriptional regulator